MSEPLHFISYSRVDGEDFALKLGDQLTAGPPSIGVWLDRRRLQPGIDWDEQLVEALRICEGFLYIMTTDSVSPNSECKKEWTRALKYRKPIIPLLVHRNWFTEMLSCLTDWSRGSISISAMALMLGSPGCVIICGGGGRRRACFIR